MNLLTTTTLREPWDVDKRLAELGLTRVGLLRVRAVAVNEARNTTPDHCANAFGMFAYQHGSWALRHVFGGKDWRLDRPNNVEAIWNESLKVRVVFSNVDVACDDEREPKPRSEKGSGAERLCAGNLFGDLPRLIPRQYSGEATYYLMVDNRAAAELARPVISNGTFSAYIEKIYLSDGSDLADDRLDLTEDGPVEQFDPQVARKK